MATFCPPYGRIPHDTRLGCAGEKFGQIGDEEISHCGNGGDARQPSQPAILNREKAPESHARVKIRPAGFPELRSDFGHARGDDGDDRKSHEEAHGAQPAKTSRDQCGQAKNAGADHSVDHERSEAPAANGANESGVSFGQG